MKKVKLVALAVGLFVVSGAITTALLMARDLHRAQDAMDRERRGGI